MFTGGPHQTVPYCLSPWCHHTTTGCHHTTDGCHHSPYSITTIMNEHPVPCQNSWIQSPQQGTGWVPQLQPQNSPRTRKHKPWCHFCPHVLLFLIASAPEDNAGPALQARRAQHGLDAGEQRWEGEDRQHHPGAQALGRLLMGQSSVEAQLGYMVTLESGTRRKEFEEQQQDGWCNLPCAFGGGKT